MRRPGTIRPDAVKSAQFRVGVLLAVGVVGALLWTPRTPAVQAAQIAPAATPTPSCPPGEFWDPTMMRCWPIRRDCPAGLIDVTGDGSVCEALDPIARPSGCVAWPTAPGLPPPGSVECALPLAAAGELLRLDASVGCLNVTRRPYPRAMVNLPVEYRVTGIIAPEQLWGVPFGSQGSYRLSAGNAWATEGLFLHERYGALTRDSYGQPAFDTRSLLAGDAYPFPSVNNVRAKLVLRMATGPDALAWTTAGISAPFFGGLSEWARTTYAWSSFPLPGSSQSISPLGPAMNGSNTLPAFRVTVQSHWDLYLNAEWDEYAVSGSHAYGLAGHHQVDVRVAPTYASYRAWDGRQSHMGAAEIYCNAAQGFIPVPVIEAQTVLR